MSDARCNKEQLSGAPTLITDELCCGSEHPPLNQGSPALGTRDMQHAPLGWRYSYIFGSGQWPVRGPYEHGIETSSKGEECLDYLGDYKLLNNVFFKLSLFVKMLFEHIEVWK